MNTTFINAASLGDKRASDHLTTGTSSTVVRAPPARRSEAIQNPYTISPNPVQIQNSNQNLNSNRTSATS